MLFSVLHFSDLHRDLRDEIDNDVLLESITRDVARFEGEEPAIPYPSLAVVSGDLVYGAKPEGADPQAELLRQYEQTEDFLVRVADRFFAGRRDRVIILPGNHDVSFPNVMSSLVEVPLPPDVREREALAIQLLAPHTTYRWRWRNFSLYRINDADLYARRLEPFAEMYGRFYQGKRSFSLIPEDQVALFDYPDIGFTCVTLNSCYENDPLRRAASIHPRCVATASQLVRQPAFAGRIIGAAWHHNLTGGPMQDDYLDIGLVQVLIDAGVSLGFHGHHHLSEFVDQRFQLDERHRHLTLVSAGTLCAGPSALPPGHPRSYNVVEIDSESFEGRLHQRWMSNFDFALPVWTAGHFVISDQSYVSFKICPPATLRPSGLDTRLALERAEQLIHQGDPRKAVGILHLLGDTLARPLLVEALTAVNDHRLTIDTLSEFSGPAEAVLLGGALLEQGSRDEIEHFLASDFVKSESDASVREIAARLRRKVAT
jgi:Calcineurin-like phosphoesterase